MSRFLTIGFIAASIVVAGTRFAGAGDYFQGWYAGVNLGASHSEAKTSQKLFSPRCASGGGGGGTGCVLQQRAVDSISPDLDEWSFTGGAQAGYNLRFGIFVLGLEADINYVDFDRTEAPSITWNATNNSKNVTSTQKLKSNYVATLRPRIGLVARDNVLLYATGGLAISDQEFSNNTTIVNLGPVGGGLGPHGRYRAESSENVGYVVGGGFEYAFTRAMTLKAEYQHLEFDNPTRTARNSILDTLSLENSTLTSRSEVSADIIRIGVNWKLGSAAFKRAGAE